MFSSTWHSPENQIFFHCFCICFIYFHCFTADHCRKLSVLNFCLRTKPHALLVGNAASAYVRLITQKKRQIYFFRMMGFFVKIGNVPQLPLSSPHPPVITVKRYTLLDLEKKEPFRGNQAHSLTRRTGSSGSKTQSHVKMNGLCCI